MIFSSSILQDNAELNDILRAQERGSLEYVDEVTQRARLAKQAIHDVVGGDFHIAFGLNITSSIAMMLPAHPDAVVVGVKEFPPVVRVVQGARKDWAGLIDTEEAEFLPISLSTDHAEYTLILSHVAYSDGEDTIGPGLHAAVESTAALKRPVHVVIDGAHAIGNHFTIYDIRDLYRSLRSRMDLKAFTYVFDLQKWIQGVVGQAIVLTTSPAIAQTLDWIFPTDASFDTAFMRFDEPRSASFNPVLPFWLLNFRNYCHRIFDHDLPTRNAALTAAFLDEYEQAGGIDVGRHRTNNLLVLEVDDPSTLHEELSQAGFRTHLIGGRRVRCASRDLRHLGYVRLAFRDGLVGTEAIGELVRTILATRDVSGRSGRR